MILQPEFPKTFFHFLQVIIASQLQTDSLRATIDTSLFTLLDPTHSGSIFLEDLYIFLKKRGVNLNKKELKFVNRYFGFSRTEKLSDLDFQRHFMSVRDPKNVKMEKGSNQAQCLVDLVVSVVQAYNEIQELRGKAARDVEELRNCLAKSYQDQSGVITRELLKEALSILKLYSRLNVSLLCNYVIGEQGKEITLKQLFLFQGSLTGEPTTTTKEPIITVGHISESKENKKLSLGTTDKIPGSFKLKSESTDILLQIQNIESAIKQKKEMYSQRKRMIEEESKSKPVGTLRKRPSQTDLKPVTREVQQIRESPFESNQSIDSYFIPREEMSQTQPFPYRETSKQKYSFIDTLEQERDQYKQVEEMLRTRVSSKCKEETLGKASSCARLKIQEIERRVMGRVGQRASKPQEYKTRVPSDLRMNSSELRSRYSSLTRN